MLLKLSLACRNLERVLETKTHGEDDRRRDVQLYT